jgi:hypothetical protein
MFPFLLRWTSRHDSQTRRPPQKTRGRIFEGLESRLAMAGNVAGAVIGGNLDLQGDVLGNQIELRDLGGGSYQVVGLGGTTVNGAASQVFGGVTGDIKAAMSRGNDVILIDEVFSAPGNVALDMGGDHDRVLFYGPAAGSIKIGRGLHVVTGSGQDVIRLGGTSVLGDAAFDTGSANDHLGAHQFAVGGSLGILTRAGDDSVSLNRTAVRGSTRIAMDDGNDDLRIGAGSLFVGSFSADLGLGNDFFRLADTTFRSEVSVNAGDGHDRVEIYGKLRFDKPAFFALGGGDDTVVVASTASIANASTVNWDGGFGFDTIVDAPANYTQPVLVSYVNFP